MDNRTKVKYSKELLNSCGVFDSSLFLKFFTESLENENLSYPFFSRNQSTVKYFFSKEKCLPNKEGYSLGNDIDNKVVWNKDHYSDSHPCNDPYVSYSDQSSLSSNQSFSNCNNPTSNKPIFQSSIPNFSSPGSQHLLQSTNSSNCDTVPCIAKESWNHDEFESLSEEDDELESDMCQPYSDKLEVSSPMNSQPNLNISSSYNSNKLNEQIDTTPNKNGFVQRELNKLKLVLDLDNTLLHGASFSKLNNININLADFINVDGEPELYKFKIPKVTEQSYYVKLRPGLRKFLKNVSNYCDLAIHTNATNEYSDVMVSILDPDHSLFCGRIVAREDDSIKDPQKKMDRLFQSTDWNTSRILILDDRKDVWDELYHPNIIQCSMYDYLDVKKTFLIDKYSTSNLTEHHDNTETTSRLENKLNSSHESESLPSEYNPSYDNLFFNANDNSSDETNSSMQQKNIDEKLSADEDELLNYELFDELAGDLNKEPYKLTDESESEGNDKFMDDPDVNIMSYDKALTDLTGNNRDDSNISKKDNEEKLNHIWPREAQHRAKKTFTTSPKSITKNMINAFHLPELYENLIDYDHQLEYLSDLIISVVKEYNNLLESNKDSDNICVSTILEAKKKSILKDVVAQTTGMYKSELNHPIFGWRDNGPLHRKRLIGLGAEVVDSPVPNLTHVLAMRSTPTLDRIRKERGDEVQYVHALWLSACEWTWTRIPESWFPSSYLLRMYQNTPPPKGWDHHWRILALNNQQLNPKIKLEAIRAFKDNQLQPSNLKMFNFDFDPSMTIDDIITSFNTNESSVLQSKSPPSTLVQRFHYVTVPKSHNGEVTSAYDSVKLIYDENVANRIKQSLKTFFDVEIPPINSSHDNDNELTYYNQARNFNKSHINPKYNQPAMNFKRNTNSSRFSKKIKTYSYPLFNKSLMKNEIISNIKLKPDYPEEFFDPSNPFNAVNSSDQNMTKLTSLHDEHNSNYTNHAISVRNSNDYFNKNGKQHYNNTKNFSKKFNGHKWNGAQNANKRGFKRDRALLQPIQYKNYHMNDFNHVTDSVNSIEQNISGSYDVVESRNYNPSNDIFNIKPNANTHFNYNTFGHELKNDLTMIAPNYNQKRDEYDRNIQV